MRELTGIFTTDGPVRSGGRFTIAALEDMLWQSFRRGIPTNLSHDTLRPIGWSQVSSLYISHEMSYVLGKTHIPETEKESEDVMRVRAAFLRDKITSRVNEYYDDFYAELDKNGLIVPEGKFFSNGIVQYMAPGVVIKAFPFLNKALFDKNGLIALSEITKHFIYKGCGVFAAKDSCFTLLFHPYLRRSMSRHNSFNTGFLDELMGAESNSTSVRISIDESCLGYAPSYVDNVEYEFWFGPSYSDDIMSIKEGLSVYVPSEVERIYNPVCKTEFIWEAKDGKRQFEMEEVAAKEMPRIDNVKYGCRYLHSLCDPATGYFDHFDGAIRAYDENLMGKRRESNLNQMGHGAEYTKLFRIDGVLPIKKWKSLITQYLKDNLDVYRYFDVTIPFQMDQKHPDEEPIDKYAPRMLTVGDGVRLLVSYQDKIADDKSRFFSNLGTLTLLSGDEDATDSLVVDLTKSFLRDGIQIDYPACSLIKCQCGFKNLPIVSHGGLKPYEAVNSSLNGISHFVSQLSQSGNRESLSFGIAWNIDEDRSVVVSCMGTVPDLAEWLGSFSSISVERKELKAWLERQAAYVRKCGRDDDNSSFYLTHIQSDGSFFQKRRLIQEDVKVTNIENNNGDFSVEMRVPEDKEELLELIDSGLLRYAPMVITDKMICTKTGQNYLSSPWIAAFGETSCQIDKIQSLSFVWCRGKGT